MHRVLVIGGGSIGERHVRCFQATGRATIALCEIDSNVCRRLAHDYHLEQTYSALSTALDHSFSAAVIATPAHLHVPMAEQLIARSLPLLIEKPLSVSLDGVPELLAKVAAKHHPVGVAYVLRNHPALAEMKQALDTGRFGRPVQVVGVSGQHFPLYRPAYRAIYYARREHGGGAIQDALTHVLNAAQWLVGPISRILADAEHCVLDGVNVEDTVHVLTRHDAVLGSFSLNQHQPPLESTLTVICEKGAVRCEFHKNRWMSCSEPGADWAIENTYSLQRDDLFIAQANQFLDQIDRSSPPACSFEEGVQTLQVNIAALESIATRRWISLQSLRSLHAATGSQDSCEA